MTNEQKIKRIQDIMEAVGKLPVAITLSEAERYVLAQWVAKIAGTAYETGLMDGSK